MSTLVGVILVIAALVLARDVLVLVAIAFLVAFLLAPLLNRIERMGLPRVPALALVMVLVMGLACVLGWVVVGQVDDLINKLPQYHENLSEKLSALMAHIRTPIEKASRTVAEIAKEASPSDSRPLQEVKVAERPSVLEGLIRPVGQILGLAGPIGIVMLLSVVLLLQREQMRDRLIRLAGGGQLLLTTRAIDEASAKVSRYLLLMCLVNGTLAVCVGIGLMLIGIPNALLWGLLFGLLRFIPYVGPLIGASMPVLLAFAVSETSTPALIALGMFLVLELGTGNVIEPWLYGTRTGVSSGGLIIAAFVWTWIWGPAGLFLATPLTVCLAVLGKHIPSLAFLHVLLGDEPALPKHAKVYQRLLATDPNEAWEIVASELETKPLIEVYDGTLIPALVLAERDSLQGTLDQAAQDGVAEAMRDLIEEAEEHQRKPAQDEAPKVEERAPIPVLCVAAQDGADHVVALMCAQLLRPLGYAPEVISHDTLKGELPARIDETNARLVLISNVPPTGIAHVRYLCKRLAARHAALPVIVGIWGSDQDVRLTRGRLPSTKSLHVVTSLAEAITVARELRESLHLDPGPDSIREQETLRASG